MTDEDLTNFWAYLQSVPASEMPNIENDMMFPANIRFGLKGWTMMFLDNEPFKKTKGKTDQWNRGAYLVEGWTHCGEGHTPRNIFMASQSDGDVQLSGATLGAVMAPNIRPEELAKQG